MEMKKLRRAAGVTAAVVAVGAGGVAAIGASASDAGKAGGGHVAKIKMEVKGKGKNADLFFQGPKKVEKGTKLKIINKTLPSKVGPHTFTLVKKNRLPKSKKGIKELRERQARRLRERRQGAQGRPADGSRSAGPRSRSARRAGTSRSARPATPGCPFPGRAQHPQGLGERRQDALLLLPGPSLHAGQDQGRRVGGGLLPEDESSTLPGRAGGCVCGRRLLGARPAARPYPGSAARRSARRRQPRGRTRFAGPLPIPRVLDAADIRPRRSSRRRSPVLPGREDADVDLRRRPSRARRSAAPPASGPRSPSTTAAARRRAS